MQQHLQNQQQDRTEVTSSEWAASVTAREQLNHQDDQRVKQTDRQTDELIAKAGTRQK